MRAAAFILSVLTSVSSLACQKKTQTEAKGVVQVPLPGAEAYSAPLAAKLVSATEAKGAGYKPRTKHLKEDGSAIFTNRLAMEPSPYLQQHAHNPVNWYPWGDEAFADAKRLDRPVFLSIGYSTCHWCHVMEEESFEDIETARFLNEHYIAIKVDREERPDVDSIYMSAIHAMGKSGGWPLNVWLTPDRRPFFGGTYFPPRDRPGRPAFVAVLGELSNAFQSDRDSLLQMSQKVVDRIEQMTRPPAGTKTVPGSEVLKNAALGYARDFDPVYGGRQAGRRGNKFPSSMPVRFLLRYYRRAGDAKYLDMAVLTLDKMAGGGMYDQAGGGFHRYSTDPKWLVPHFEKMLYDNALLVPAYVEAYQVTGDARHAEVARHILAYVARDMRAPGGGFYSATDADSLGPEGEREEGYYFTWTPQEVDSLLGPDRAKLAKAYFGVTQGGNFEGRSILNVRRPLSEVASEQGLSDEEAKTIISEARESLYKERQKRPAPLTDDKVLVAWNGLMISAYAQAAKILGPDSQRELDYITIAQEAADFILGKMRVDGRLLRSFQGGKAHLSAYVDDYAFFISGLLDLHLATGEMRWLKSAIDLQTQLDAHYADTEGAYFMTADDAEKGLTREKPTNDGAIPSGNSYAIFNLLRLHQLTSKESYLHTADAGLMAMGQLLAQNPTSLSELLLALEYRTDAVKQIVIVAKAGASTEEFRVATRSVFLPNQVYIETEEGEALVAVEKYIPLVGSKLAIGGKVTAYVCEDSHCELPTSDVEVFKKQLSVVKPL